MSSAPDSLPVYPPVPLSLVRPAVIVGIVCVGVLVASGLLGHVWVGVFFAGGAALILLNSKMVQASVGSATASDHPRKRPVVLNAAVRLGIITVIALVLAIVFRPEGIGVMFGLAVGQVIVVLSTVLPVMKGLRTQS